MRNVLLVHAQLNKMISENPALTYNLDLNETNIILAALQELPGKICNPLSDKIKFQANEQIKALKAAEAAQEVKVIPG